MCRVFVVHFQVDEGARALDQSFVIGVVRSGFFLPEPEGFKHIMGIEIFTPVEAIEIAGVAGVFRCIAES